MIDTVDKRIQQWIGKFEGSAQVFLVPPSEMRDKQGVSLHLMEVAGDPPARGVRRPPLSLLLRYLVTTWFEDAVKAHRLLGELTFAAMEAEDMATEPAPLPPAVWQAFGIPPRPSLVLRVPLKKPREEKLAPRVRGRISVQFGKMRPFRGQIFGPGGIPVASATVTLPSLQMRTRTDYLGRFTFAAVPAEPPVRELQVNARGRDVSLPVPAGDADNLFSIELNEGQI